MANPEWDNYRTPDQRYRIMSDGDHEYFIPVDKETAFEGWCRSEEGDLRPDEEYTGPDFSENRIDGRFTFTDPRND